MKPCTWLLAVVGLMVSPHLFGASGSLDPTFGTGGKVTTDFSAGEDAARAVVVQPDGKIVAFGVVIQTDGKIVAAGAASHVVAGAVNTDFGLARYNTDGTLDTGFGNGGQVTTDFSGSFDEAEAIALQLDGRVVLAGRTRTQTSTSSNDDFALSRYNTDGSLDTSFGTAGKVMTDFTGIPGFDEAHALAIQSDGKVVAVGLAMTTSKNDFALARYNTNGVLDATFGSGGKVITDFSGADVNAQAVAILLDG